VASRFRDRVSTRGRMGPLSRVTEGATARRQPGTLRTSVPEPIRNRHPVEASRELELFLRSIAPRAFRVARLGLREDQDALDAVQEAMIKLVRRYATRPEQEWGPLFYAILRNCVHDLQRSHRSRNSLMAWLKRFAPSDENEAIDARVDAPPGPSEQVESEQNLTRLERAIARLPARQREAFLLRHVEEMDVRETAAAMGCTEGSVKTHHSRAVRALRENLGDL
jgi:RNA polymerase sigma-70 factor, ECF subfamily